MVDRSWNLVKYFQVQTTVVEYKTQYGFNKYGDVDYTYIKDVFAIKFNQASVITLRNCCEIC